MSCALFLLKRANCVAPLRIVNFYHQLWFHFSLHTPSKVSKHISFETGDRLFGLKNDNDCIAFRLFGGRRFEAVGLCHAKTVIITSLPARNFPNFSRSFLFSRRFSCTGGAIWCLFLGLHPRYIQKGIHGLCSGRHFSNGIATGIGT